jgi:four helix bundle protein
MVLNWSSVEGRKSSDRNELIEMRGQFRFEKLEVWQDARRVNVLVYNVSRQLPKEELYAMTSQLRRAATSVSSTIAEGAGRNSDKDFAHFLEQAYGSLMEVASLLYLAVDQKYVTNEQVDTALIEIETLAKRIAALNRSLAVDKSKTPFTRQRLLDPGPSRSTLDPRPSTLE